MLVGFIEAHGENSNWIKIEHKQEALYVNSYVHV